jgi:cytoskeletal protein CcmA (bactofilin family)
MAWMKNKNETETRPVPQPATRTEQGVVPPQRENSMEKVVNIGQSVEILGELTGNEDLSIEGKIDGKIILKGHNLTVGANGRIKGEVHAKAVVVVGEMNGNIVADDKVELAATGSMHGDIRAPRVVLADGARFKGSIDMDSSTRAVEKKPSSSHSSGVGIGEKAAAMSAKSS